MRKKYESSQRLEEVRFRILTTAKELFVQQGYKKTTIRQIVQKSGILTGSIYYFFKNKEDIFQALILSLLKECVRLIDENFHEESPAFRYVAMCLVELKAVEINELAREAYYEGYTSPVIFEKMVRHVTDITIDMFASQGLPYSKDEYYARTLLIKGAMRSYVAQFYFSQSVLRDNYIPILLKTALSLLNVSEEEIYAIQKRLEKCQNIILSIAEQLIEQRVEI